MDLSKRFGRGVLSAASSQERDATNTGTLHFNKVCVRVAAHIQKQRISIITEHRAGSTILVSAGRSRLKFMLRLVRFTVRVRLSSFSIVFWKGGFRVMTGNACLTCSDCRKKKLCA